MHINKQNGFTLLEILIAVFIVGIISVVMLRGLETAITTKNHLERNAIRLENVEFALALLNNDIQNIVNQSIIGTDGSDMVPVFLHPDATQMLEFTRGGVANPLGAPRTTLARIAYSWQGGNLVRTTWSTLNRTADTQQYTRILVNGVTNVQWRFLSSTTNFAQNNWTGAWPSASMFGDMPLPRAIELTMKIQGWGDITRVFVVNAQNPPKQVGPVQP